jgi:hypothetical protein
MGEKMRVHTLAWPDVDTRMINAHESVMKHFGISATYYRVHMPHGEWMDKVCKDEFETGAEVVCFLEIDCVPTCETIMARAYRWTKDNRGILGIAQSANHLDPCHIYAGPAFYMVHRDAWQKVGKTFSEQPTSDVAQEFTKVAERLGVRVRCIYPLNYLYPADEGRWVLGNYGYFGRGTHYSGGVFHMFQGRTNNAINTFVDVCDKIVTGHFSTGGWYESAKL